METVPPKTCSECTLPKPLAEFDLRASYCKACRREKRRAAYVPHPQPRREVYAGQPFGHLTVICEVAKKGRRRQARCSCKCGVVKEISLERRRRASLRHTTEQRALKREAQRRHRRGSVRFVLLVLTLVATAVVVTVVMFRTLYLLLG